MTSSTQVFAEVEQEAYDAFREWPLWLVLRQRQLEQATALTRPPDDTLEDLIPTDTGEADAQPDPH
ncbi:MAG: hypothetical protein L0154_26485 [Chloroflexi bacterium]|nr:hypothetical protein [Chloroflexota bacterium]